MESQNLLSTHRIDQRRDPRRPESAGTVHVIGVVADGRDPGKVGELAGAHVGDELPIRRNDVFAPIGPVVNVLHGLIARPIAAVAARRRAVFARVEAPRKTRLIEFVAERLIIEAGGLRRPDFAILRDRRNVVARAAAAAPLAVRQVHARVGLCRDDVLMAHETLVQVRLKHPVAEHPFVRHIEVRLRVALRHVNVFGIFDAARTLVVLFFVEAIHSAVGPSQRTGAVASGEHRLRRVIDHVLVRERYGQQLNRFAVGNFTAVHRIGAGIAVKEIIEAPVLLHDINDVRYLAGSGRVHRLDRRTPRHIRQRLRARRATGQNHRRDQAGQ